MTHTFVYYVLFPGTMCIMVYVIIVRILCVVVQAVYKNLVTHTYSPFAGMATINKCIKKNEIVLDVALGVYCIDLLCTQS